MVQGSNHSGPYKDSRLQITGPILHKLVQGLPSAVPNLRYRVLLKSIILLTFNAFLLLGEVVVKSKCFAGTVIKREDVSIEFCNNTPSSVVILLRNFKTNKKKDLFHIHFKASTNSDMCPVLALHHYLNTFGHISGPLFQFMGGEPVSYEFVSKDLHNTVSLIGLNPALFKCHSFRVGAAT